MLRDYSPLMSEATENGLEKVIKIGAAFSEVSPQLSHIEIIKTMTRFS